MGSSKNKSTTGLAVEYLQGLHLVDSILWLDAPRKADLCFISHAHLSTSLTHEKVFLSEATAVLAEGLIDPHRTLVSPMLRNFALGGLDLSLHPSGHMLGASQLLIRRDQERLAYTGHFDLNPRRLGEQGRILDCEHLLIHAQHAEDLPPRENEEKALTTWAKSQLAKKRQPVLLCQGLGTAQELAALLTEEGLSCAHLRALSPVFRTYRQLDSKQATSRAHRGGGKTDVVLLAPHHLAQSKPIARLTRASLAQVSGRRKAQKDPSIERHFFISSHADRKTVVRYAQNCRARRITLLGPAAEPLALRLRENGLRAWALRVPTQLQLNLKPSAT